MLYEQIHRDPTGVSSFLNTESIRNKELLPRITNTMIIPVTGMTYQWQLQTVRVEVCLHTLRMWWLRPRASWCSREDRPISTWRMYLLIVGRETHYTSSIFQTFSERRETDKCIVFSVTMYTLPLLYPVWNRSCEFSPINDNGLK